MSAYPYTPGLHQQLMGPPEPPERGDHAWLFADGEVHLVRVVGRAVLRRAGRDLPATSCVLCGRVTIVPTERLLAVPAGDPYRMPVEASP